MDPEYAHCFHCKNWRRLYNKGLCNRCHRTPEINAKFVVCRRTPAPQPVKRGKMHDHDVDPMSCNRLVMEIALRYGADPAAVLDSPYYAAGWTGLMRAWERFNPGLGLKFTTYAYRWIEQPILDMIREAATAKRGAGETLVFADVMPIVSADELEASFGLEDYRSAERPPLDDRELLWKYLMPMLRKRERAVVKMSVLDGMTLDAIGRRIGVTKERVRQILNVALGKMRTRAVELDAA